jgi:hypothetical protein
VSFTGAVKYPPASVDLRSMHRFCSKVRDQPLTQNTRDIDLVCAIRRDANRV